MHTHTRTHTPAHREDTQTDTGGLMNTRSNRARREDRELRSRKKVTQDEEITDR